MRSRRHKLSFNGFQGSVGSVGSTPAAGSSAFLNLERAKALVAQRKAEEAAKREAAALNNRTGKGLILDTNKQAGGAVNIPNSNFVIVGGKAIPKSALGSNIARSTPSILTRDGRRLTASSPNLTDAQKQALGIIAGQQQATFNTAEKIATERRLQGLSGKSTAEAQKIATSPEKVSFSTKDRNVINTALQTDIIRSNNAKLNFAQQKIAEQVANPEGFNTLDDLETLLASAPNQDAPIQQINVSTDEFGNVVSPRNVKLQIENAGLTGGLTQPQLNILTSGGAAPNVEEVAQVIQQSLNDITDGAEIGQLTSVTTNPDGTLQIDFSENSPEIFRQQFGDTVFETLGRFFNLKDQGVDDFFDNPEGLRVKIGEEEVSLGGTGGGGFASELVDGEGDILSQLLGFVTNPLVLIGIAIIAGFVIFTKVRK